jgi:RNA polymerase sigma-70 factor (ECF subfamily)
VTVSSDERALLDAVRRGEEAAFRLLYREHARRVYSVARRLVGDAHLADDVAQEAWFRAVRKLGQFRGDSKFSTWLVGIALRCALEALKRRKRDAASGPEIERDTAKSQLSRGRRALRLHLDRETERTTP